MADQEWQGPPGIYVWLLALCCALLYGRRVVSSKLTASYLDRATSLTRLPPSFYVFQRSFLLPFFVGSLAFQQHTLYNDSLYESHGFMNTEVAYFLAVGQASALFLGTFAASAADSLGRKRACVLFGVLHLIGCLGKLSSSFYALCFAHVVLGVAASLFATTFEAWVVAEHDKAGLKQDWLSITFWVMTFGASVMGIASGALANFWVGSQGYGVSTVSVAAAGLGGLCAVLVGILWDEKRVAPQVTISKVLSSAFQSLTDKNVLLIGFGQSSVHFSISVFWLLWTPTLVADGRQVQLGTIYIQLMASMMLGSIIAATLMCGPWFMRPEKFLAMPLLLAAYALFVAAYDYEEVSVLVSAFCGFHLCVGVILPSLARLRSSYLPNERRASVMSFCLVPSNAVLWLIFVRAARLKQLENSTTFGLCVFGLTASAVGLLFLDHPKRLSSEAYLVGRNS